MVDAEVEFIAMHILREVDKTGAAVLKDIIDQFLDDTEDHQLFFSFEPVLVFMKTAAGINAAGTTDLLEQVIHGRLQPEILQGRRHQAMADITDELDGIINDLAGLEDRLQLGGLILVHQILIQIQTGCGQQGTGIIVQVGSQALAFLFLQFDRGIQQDFCWSCSICCSLFWKRITRRW